MVFSFLGTVIQTLEETEEYRKYKCMFSEIARDECDKLEEKYTASGTLDNVKKEVEHWGQESRDNAIDSLIKLLIKQGIVTISRSILEDEYLSDPRYETFWESDLMEFLEEVYEDVGSEEKRLELAYRDPQLIAALRNILAENISYMSRLYVDILNAELNLNIHDGIEEKNHNRAMAMLENIEEGYVTEQEAIRDILITCVKLDPFISETYIYSVEHFGDSDCNLDKMAGYYGIQLQDMKTVRFGAKIINEAAAAKSPQEIRKKLEESLDYYGMEKSRFLKYLDSFKSEEEKTAGAEGSEDDKMNADESAGAETEAAGDEAVKEEVAVAGNADKISERNGRQFCFLGYPVEITEEEWLYNWLLDEYYDQATKKAAELRKLYWAAGDIDTVVSKIEGWGTKGFTQIAEETLDMLAKLGIYTVDIGKINSQYVQYMDFNDWNNAVEALGEKFVKCAYSEEQMKAYREQRKANRGRFVGGGFGISGAIKGSMKAGALNAATGMAHSVVNAMGNFASDMRINSNKSKLYKNNNTIEDLCKGFIETAYSMVNIFCKIMLYERGTYVGPQSEQDAETVRAIVNNIKNGRYPEENIREALIQCVERDYYNSDVYYLAISYFGDEDRELERMADFFGKDAIGMKQNLFVKMIQEAEKIADGGVQNKAQVSDYQDAKDKFLQREKFLGYSSPRQKEIFEKLDEEIAFCNMPLRVAYGKLYETEEAAAEARKELAEIVRIADDQKLSYEQALTQVKELSFENSDIQEKREEILLDRRKLRQGDKEAFLQNMYRIKIEEIDLVHFQGKYSRRYHMIYEGYLNERYFDRNSENYERMAEKVGKAIAFVPDEFLCFFLTCETGVFLNDSGMVVTNKKLYFLQDKKVVFQTKLDLIDQINAEEERCIVYTQDSKIFSFKMNELCGYKAQVMARYFNHIVTWFRNLYGKEDRSEINDKTLLPDETLLEAYERMYEKIHLFQRKYELDTSTIGLKVLTRKDKEFAKNLEGIKIRIGQRLFGENPALILIDGKKSEQCLLITDRKLYFVIRSLKVICLDEIADLSNEGLVGRKLVFTLKNGEKILCENYPESFFLKEKELIVLLREAMSVCGKLWGGEEVGRGTPVDEGIQKIIFDTYRTLFERVHKFTGGSGRSVEAFLLTAADEGFTEDFKDIKEIMGINLTNEIPLMMLMNRKKEAGGGVLATDKNLHIVSTFRQRSVPYAQIKDIVYKDTFWSSGAVIFVLDGSQVKQTDYVDDFVCHEEEYIAILKEAVRTAKELERRLGERREKDIPDQTLSEDSRKETEECPKCGEIIPAGKKFCSKCGNPLQIMVSETLAVEVAETEANSNPVVQTEIEPVAETGAEPEPKLATGQESLETGAGAKPAAGQESLAELEAGPESKPAAGQKPVADPEPVAKKESEQSRNCPKCGNLLKPGKKFCSKCGYSLQSMNAAETQQETERRINCAKCGNLIKPGKKFCSVCGLKIQ